MVGSQRLVNWLVTALSMVAKFAVSLVMNGLMGHGFLEMDWGAVVSVVVDNGLVHDGLVVHWHFVMRYRLVMHNSLMNDWDGLVMNDSLVVHNWHDVADNLVVDWFVVRSGLVDNWGVMVHWLS